MEQKRILWITAAVGSFLLVVIGAALIIYAPQSSSDPVMASIKSQNDAWINPTTVSLSDKPLSADQNTLSLNQPDIDSQIIELSSSQDIGSQTIGGQGIGSQTIESIDTQSIVLDRGESISNGTTIPFTTQNIDVTENPTPLPTTTSLQNTIQTNDLTVISNNTRVYSADGITAFNLSAAEQPIARVDIPKNTQSSLQTSPVEPRPAPPVETPKVRPPISMPVAKVTPTPAPISIPKAIANQYWVQAASFTSKENANVARTALKNEKISSEIFTHTKNGTTYYRLRVGPYTTKSEADYWNIRIKLIDQFEATESYVTNSTKQKA